MQKRIVLFLLFLLLPASGIFAQADSTAFCGDLPAPDCDILRQSQTVMRDVESMDFAFNMGYDISGFGDSFGMDSVVFSISGNGMLAFDIRYLYSLYGTSPEAMTGNLSDYTGILIDFLKSIQGEATLAIRLPAELSSPALGDIAFDIIMVDGTIYLDTAPLTGLSQPSWIGLDFASFYENMLEETMSQMEGMDLSALMSSNLFQNIYSPEYMGRFRAITRLEDAEVMGISVAVFEHTFDFASMFSDEQFIADFKASMETALGTQGLDDLGTDTDTFLDLLLSIYQDVEIQYRLWIGLDDYYVHRADMSLGLSMNMENLTAFGSAPAPGVTGNISIGFDASIDMSDFNQPVEVTAPPNAQIIDPFAPFGSSM